MRGGGWQAGSCGKVWHGDALSVGTAHCYKLWRQPLLMLSFPAQLDLAPATTGSLAALLLLVAACGACDGFAQGALFGEAALLPPQYTQALVSGTAASGEARMTSFLIAHHKLTSMLALCRSWLLLLHPAVQAGRLRYHPMPAVPAGVAVSLLRVLTKATLPDTEAGLRHSANLYFLLTALVCASCTAVYSCVLPRLSEKLRQAALQAAIEDDGSGGNEPAGWKLLDGRQQAAYSERHAAPYSEQQQQQRHQRAGRPSLDVELSYEDHAHSRFDSSMAGSWHEQPHHQQQQIAEDEQLELAGEAALLQGQHTMSHSSSAGWLHDRHGAAAGRLGHGSPAAGDASLGAAALQRGQELGAPLAPHSALAVFQRLWRLEMAVMTIYM